MYSPQYTQRKIEAVADRINARRKEGAPEWVPTYHSRNQIEHAIDHLNSLWDVERKALKRPLTKDESAFIQNERRICALDFRGYWAKHYCWIVDWKQEAVRFDPNVAQNIIMDIWGDREADELAIWMLQLKARRLGVSTLSELAVGHRFQFSPHSNCVVASADPTKSLEMAGMIHFNITKQPWWLLPQGKPKISQGMPVEYPDIDTGLTIQAGNQFTGVARGATPNVIHLSEMASWPDARTQIDGSLMKAVIDSPNVFAIMESTAWGTGNWLHDTWEISKAEHEHGRSRVIPVFLPWFVGIDLYPSASDLAARPIPKDWTPSDRVVNHAERARQYVLSNDLLFTHLAKGDRDWRMPRQQMWYHEIEYEQARKKKELNIFLSELPADDVECFQSPNLPIIDPEILMGYHERTREPLGVYTLVGPDIPEALITPRRFWDHSKKPIAIPTGEITPKHAVKYQLVPLLYGGASAFNPDLKLLIWEWPDANDSYGVGVDTSEGLGQDNAAIEVLREATPFRPPGQVAEWVSDHVTAFELWPFVHAIGCLYSVFRASAGKRVQTRLAIECMGNGAACQNELQKRGWRNLHPWKAYDNRQPRKDAEVNKLGIYTNYVFRAQMLDMLLTHLKEEALDIPSMQLVQELQRLERRDGVAKVEASYGAHDDRVMAIGFPLFSLHMGKPAQKQFVRQRIDYVPGEPEQQKTYPVYPGVEQGMDLSNPTLMRVQSRPGFRRQLEVARATNRGLPRVLQ